MIVDTQFFRMMGFSLMLLVLPCQLGRTMIWLICAPWFTDKLKKVVETNI